MIRMKKRANALIAKLSDKPQEVINGKVKDIYDLNLHAFHPDHILRQVLQELCQNRLLVFRFKSIMYNSS